MTNKQTTPDLWYDISNIEKKGCLFNAIISARSGGKTIAVKRRMVKEGLKGNKFVYVRRLSKELDNKKMEMFFAKMQSIGYYDKYDLTYEKGVFYLDGEVIGYATGLSTSVNERSVDFVGVTDIYFEEFVLKEDSKHKYLKDEVFTFLELYSTIARQEDVRVWLIGNKIQEYNPYFLYFNLIPPKKGIKVWNDFAIEVWDNPKFIEYKKQSRFAKLTDGTGYNEYAILNESYENNLNFIRNTPPRSTPLFNVLYNRDYFMVWLCMDGSVQIDQSRDFNFDITCIDEKDSAPDIIPIKFYKRNPRGTILTQAVKSNKLFFKNAKCEEIGRMLARIAYFGG